MSLWQRFLFQVEAPCPRSPNNQKIKLPATTPCSRSPRRPKVIVVQGFGRFGLFGPSESDSTVRFDLRQDWGVILWLPLVLSVSSRSVRLGRGSVPRRPAADRHCALSSGPLWPGWS